jgi:hypothetical protein
MNFFDRVLIAFFVPCVKIKKMVTKTIAIIFGIALISLSSCFSTSTNTEKESEASKYTFDSEQKADLKWTAFKTTDKLPVSGTFNEVKLTGSKEAESLEDLMATISFSIPISSTSSTNPERDAKIVNSFFGAMENTSEITGDIKKLNGNDKKGTCIVLLTFNNIEKEQELSYTYDGQKISLSGELNLIRFGGEKAIRSLNEVCKLLHAGPDGISKTWSTVDLVVDLEINKSENN